jgi:hypothetical protein
MKHSDTGNTVTHIFDPYAPVSLHVREEIKALKKRPIDFSDIPEVHIDSRWVMPGLGDCLGLMLARARQAEHEVPIRSAVS